MKKLLVIMAALIMNAASLFALENSIDLNFSIPTLSSTSSTSITLFGNTTTVKTKTNSTAYGFSFNDQVMVSDLVGLKAGLDISWPSSWKATTTTTTNGNSSSSTTNGSFNNCTDINGFIGLAVRSYQNKNISVFIVPGVNMNWYSYTNDDTTKTNFHFGFGADFAVNYKLNNDFYLSASCPFVWYITEKNDGTSNDNFKGSFQAIPKIGLGYRF